MELLLYILLILFLLILLIITLPIYIIINSDDNFFAIGLFHIILIRIIPDVNSEKIITIRIKTPVYTYNFYPLEKIINSKKKEIKQSKSKESKKQRKETKSSKSINFQLIINLLYQIIKSFKIHYFYLNIDTRNYILNGLLIPVFANFTNQKSSLKINFNEDIFINFKMSNRLINIIYPTVVYFISNKGVRK